MEWKGRRNVTWDACSKCVGGAERTGWDTLLEMETKGPVGEARVLEPLLWWWTWRRLLRWVSSMGVWEWSMYIDCPPSVLRCALWLLRS